MGFHEAIRDATTRLRSNVMLWPNPWQRSCRKIIIRMEERQGSASINWSNIQHEILAALQKLGFFSFCFLISMQELIFFFLMGFLHFSVLAKQMFIRWFSTPLTPFLPPGRGWRRGHKPNYRLTGGKILKPHDVSRFEFRMERFEPFFCGILCKMWMAQSF